MRDEIGICPNLASQFVLISDRCLSYGKKVTVTQSTYRDYRSTMEVYAIPHFGKTPLCNVAYRDVEEFVEKLMKLSAKRKNNIMVPVKCLFNDAKRRGDIRENPCEMIRRFKEEKPQIDPLSFPKMKHFLQHVDPLYRALPEVCPEPVLLFANIFSMHLDSAGDNPRNSSAVPTFHPLFSNIFCFAVFIWSSRH